MESSRNRVVILDTSTLLSIFERKVDVLDEVSQELGRVRFLVPKSVIKELEKLSSLSKGSRRRKAKAALDLVRKMDLDIVDSKIEDDVDRDLIELSKDLKAMVVTLDKELMDKLRKESIGIITWKNRRFRFI